MKRCRIFALVLVLCVSCNFVNGSNNVEENTCAENTVSESAAVDLGRDTAKYQYVTLSTDLIEKLGGPSVLKDYQFYLSAPLELRRYENKSNNNGAGSIHSRDDVYTITFTEATPGVFRKYECNRSTDPNIRPHYTISVYFDEGPNDYLFFSYSYQRDKFVIKNLHDATGSCEHDSFHKVYYAGHSWYSSPTPDSAEGPALMLQMRRERFEHIEQAKGRKLSNCL